MKENRLYELHREVNDGEYNKNEVVGPNVKLLFAWLIGASMHE